MRNLARMTGLVAAGTVVFSTVPPDTRAVIDPLILVYIATAYTIAVIIMLVYTRKWSLIGCALLATMTGDALLYGRLSHHLPVPGGDWVLDVIRACFVVGGTYLVIGLFQWVREQEADDAVLMSEKMP